MGVGMAVEESCPLRGPQRAGWLDVFWGVLPCSHRGGPFPAGPLLPRGRHQQT